MRLVEIHPLRLVERAFIPVHPEPLHSIEDRFLEFLRGTLEVRVFYTEYECAPVVSGEEPVEESGSGPSDMERAGW